MNRPEFLLEICEDTDKISYILDWNSFLTKVNNRKQIILEK
jgi:hypothetical protein